MKCDLCDKPAVVHEVSINNGVKKEVHLCLEHAQAAGLSIPGQQPINQLLKTFITGQAATPEAKRCTGCGSTFAQIRQSNLIGCPECYTTFHEPLSSLIEQAQFRSTEHVGRVPNQHHTPTQVELRTRKLLKDLDAAVTAEQYERAADLRDRLDKLSTELPKNEQDRTEDS